MGRKNHRDPTKPLPPIRRILSSKEIAEEVVYFDNLHRKSIQPDITPAIAKQRRKIREAGANGAAHRLQIYFNGLCKAFGRSLAVNLFEHILEIDRTKYWTPAQQGRPDGPADRYRDERILATCDGNNPNSLLSQAKRGDLSIEGNKLRLADPKETPQKNARPTDALHLRLWPVQSGDFSAQTNQLGESTHETDNRAGAVRGAGVLYEQLGWVSRLGHYPRTQLRRQYHRR